MAEYAGDVANRPDVAAKSTKKMPVCKFHLTAAGCRASEKCRFLHPSPETAFKDIANTDDDRVQASSSATLPTPTPIATQPLASRVVARPVPKAQTEDPRNFQISQILRRFKATSTESEGTTTLAFGLKPTDPDFPYDITVLECELAVPASYPSSRPTCKVLNKDIPRGFQINIARGFDTIAAESVNSTLLTLVNRLDQRLEAILAGKAADTVTLVSNQTTKPAATAPQPPPPVAPSAPRSMPKPPTEQQLQDARNKRESSVRQLEARFSKVPSFSKSKNGLTYTLPLDSPKRLTWPAPLRSLTTMRVTVPEQYPLEPLVLYLGSDSPEASAVEEAFRERSREIEGSITQQINYLSQHIKDMAVVPSSEPAPSSLETPRNDILKSDKPVATSIPPPRTENFDKSHIHHIPRPPEWDVQQHDSDDNSADSDPGSDFDTDDEDTAEEVEEVQEQAPASAPAERGILLSFPHLDLHGIELVELTSLNITVKCERCKDITDVERLRSVAENAKMRELSCKKCAAVLAVRFRADLIHANSVRAGYLDLDGCTVVDMLPSNFIPTCSECSTAYPAPGVVAVRGDSSMAICRECHRKMTFRIMEVKFLLVSASAIRASRAPGKKKAKENLGITVGTELPRRGRCPHYRKSYRWFRFSCCQKVFPCDRCHDEQEDHPNEHANRMLCGYCSREQNYRPEDCGTCHAPLTGKKGSGFWEGGKGTRDPMRMSRKDPRKYKRRPGTKPKT